MQLYIDCDGVLADFEGYARSILHEDVNLALRRDEASVWQILRRAEVFRHLPVREDGMKLFRAIRHLHPVILTGCPPGGWAEQQKREWAEEDFPGVRMLTCSSKDKRNFMENPGDILIDDYKKYRSLWENAGGIFVLYRNTQQTLQELAPHLAQR